MSIFDHGTLMSKDRLTTAATARQCRPVPPAPVKRDLLQEELQKEIREYLKLLRARPVEPVPPPSPEMLAAIALVEQADGLIAQVFYITKPVPLHESGLVENYRSPGTRRVVAGPRPCRKFGDR